MAVFLCVASAQMQGRKEKPHYLRHKCPSFALCLIGGTTARAIRENATQRKKWGFVLTAISTEERISEKLSLQWDIIKL